MGYQPTRETSGFKAPFQPKTPTPKRRSLLRCEYCGMSFDGEEYENCPHCNAPRPSQEQSHHVDSPESCVKAVYIGDFAYAPMDAQRIIAAANEESETTYFSDNTFFATLRTKRPDFERIANYLGIVPLEKIDGHTEVEGKLVSGMEAHKLLTPCPDIADDCVRVREACESLTKCGCGYVRLTSGEDVGPERSITWHEESIKKVSCEEPMVWFRTLLDDSNHMHTVAIEERYTLNTKGLVLFSKNTYTGIAMLMADEFGVDVSLEYELVAEMIGDSISSSWPRNVDSYDGHKGNETHGTLGRRLRELLGLRKTKGDLEGR